jgi:hypothetical protein
MRFTWTDLLLAPLPVPLISAALVVFLQDHWSTPGFLILLIPGCIVSYGTTLFVFLPCLYLLSLWSPLTGWRVCLVGLLLGAAMFVPVTLVEWKSSGPDSGPPAESFFRFFLRWADDPLTMIFPVAGLITAGLYWWLGTWRLRRSTAARE